jgi:hypothetical protein
MGRGLGLANHDPKVRWAARGYLASVKISSERLVREARPGDQALWVSLAAINLHARLEGKTTHTVALHRIQNQLTDEFISGNNDEVAVPAAMALIKLGGSTDPLIKLSHKKIDSIALSKAVPDILYLSRTSSRVRSITQNTSSTWLSSLNSNLKDIDKVSEGAEISKVND